MGAKREAQLAEQWELMRRLVGGLCCSWSGCKTFGGEPMGAKREAQLAEQWELWSRGDLDSCFVVHRGTGFQMDLPGSVLKALAREHFLQIVEDVTEKLAEIDAWKDERP